MAVLRNDEAKMTDAQTSTLLESFVEALPQAVLVIGDEYRLIAANAAARKVLPALRPRDLLARGLRAPDVLDAISRVLETGQPETAFWLDRVPLEQQFEVHVAPLNAVSGLRAVVVALHDITETRRLERMRADFVANASHELRTPLASLLGFVDTLQGPARDDAVARERFLAIMSQQGRRMARLVEDLLSLSRIEQNLHIRPDELVDLTSVVSHMADTLRPMAEDEGVDLRINAPSPVYVQGDRDELLRVAENLIENAIKYGGQAPVDVSVRADNGSGLLVVRDHGPGIASEHIPRLTERFYRVDAGQSRAKGGTGLGLAIVKHIVARHRGRLTIESALGAGTAFTVSLPRADV